MEKYRILVKGIVQYSDKFLIVEKWYDDRIVNPYQWEFIDGQLDFGENPDEAVIRLVQQKTGLSVQLNRLLYTWSFMVGDVCNIGISYLCISVSDEINLSEDLNDFRWVSKDDFEDYIENQSILQDIQKVEL